MSSQPARREESNSERTDLSDHSQDQYRAFAGIFHPRPEKTNPEALLHLSPLPESSLDLSGWNPEQETRLRALMSDGEFREATTRREQIRAAVKQLRNFSEGQRFTLEQIGRFLGGAHAATIVTQNKLSLQERRIPGRPSLLSDAIIKWMVDLTRDRFESRNPVTYPELLDLIQAHYDVSLCADTLRHIIRNLDAIKSVLGIPMERERVAVDPAEIEAWFRNLAAEVAGVPRDFVFNVDESGCSDHTDSHEVRVIAPVDYPNPSVPVPYDRHSKRSTLVACIAADGFRMKPFVIVHRATVERELKYYGYDERNVMLVSQVNAFMTRALFELWATTVFFPTIDERRRELAYHDKIILLMDGLGAHHTDKFLADCTARNVKVIFLVPHASDQIQPLDLLTFAVMKQRFSASKFERLSNPQSNKIVRILGAWFAASVPHYNVEAFMSMGLIPEDRGGQIFLKVVPEEARRVRGIGMADVQPPGDLFGSDGQRRVRLPNGDSI